MTMQGMIRNATPTDFNAISSLDNEVIGTAIDRSDRISRAIAESRFTIISAGSALQGFAIANPNGFREMDFLDLVVVGSMNRRQGIATRLIEHFRHSSSTSQCWTSTNQSNEAMISLLRKLGWYESNHIEYLDFGDPELFFYIN